MDLTVFPFRPSGSVTVPPSKSFAHRAIFAALLCRGKSVLKNVDLSNDVMSTLNVVEKLGSSYKFVNNVLEIYGGLNELLKFEKRLIEVECLESASTLRFLIPIALAFGKSVLIKVGKNLAQRPLQPYFDVFEKYDVTIKKSTNYIYISGQLKAGEYEIDCSLSSQFITGLLFALPNLAGESVIKITSRLPSKPYVNITLNVLENFGVNIFEDKNKYAIKGRQEYNSCEYEIEGDHSQAAFFEVLGCLNPICIKGLNPNSIQGDAKMIELISRAGAGVEWENGVLKIRPGDLDGFCFDVENFPDLAPPIAVMACMCKGKSLIKGVSRLKFKESDRVSSIFNMIKSIGGNITYSNNCFCIKNVDRFSGGVVDSSHDHRIAMAASIAAAYSKNPIVILGAECVKKSYPGFYADYQSLGGDIFGFNLE